jgi:hypothetical protein
VLSLANSTESTSEREPFGAASQSMASMSTRVWLWAIGMLVLSACSGARPADATKAQASVASRGASEELQPEAYGVDDARERLQRDEQQLLSLLLDAEGARAPASAPPLPIEPKAPRQSSATPSRDGLADSGDTPAAQPLAIEHPNRCVIACRALASMRRAERRLCELTGEQDEVCSDARARVARSESRVRRSCPACDAR